MNKLGHVVEEADESVYWLELIDAAYVSPGPELTALIQEARELSAIFNQSQLTAKANAGKGWYSTDGSPKSCNQPVNS